MLQIFQKIRNHLAANSVGVVNDAELVNELIKVIFCKLRHERSLEEDRRFDVKEVQKRFLEVKEECCDIFRPEEQIRLDESSLKFVTDLLQEIRFSDSSRDSIGSAFESFIVSTLRGGQGQFFTPRNVVKAMIRMIDPQPDERILDPACGSGGFLVETLFYTKNNDQCLIGVDKDSTLTRICKQYLCLLDAPRSRIFCENSLYPIRSWQKKTREQVKPNSFDVILTNPPFGRKLVIQDPKVLRYYELGLGSNNELRKSQSIQILFLERCIQLLKRGGRLGIILPEGIIGNPSLKYVREFLLREGHIEAIVDLPVETFLPWTSTKTCFLLFEKEEKKGKTFLHSIEFVGHDRRGKTIDRDDLAKVHQIYKRRRGHWAELEAINFNPRRYILRPSAQEKAVSLKILEDAGLIEITPGIEPGSKNYQNSGIPFIRVSDVFRMTIRRDVLHYLDPSKFKGHLLKAKDLLLTKDGTIGKVGIVSRDRSCVISSGIVRIRVLQPEKLSSYNLLESLLDSQFQKRLAAEAVTGASITHLSLKRLKEIPFIIKNKKEKLIQRYFELASKLEEVYHEISD